MKSRFRCIDTSGGTLLYSSRKCYDIVLVVVVLHNMCIMNGIPLPAGDDNDYPDNGHIAREQYGGNLNDGARVCDRLFTGRF